LQKILLAMLSLTMFVGLAMSVDGPLEESSKRVQFSYEDSTSGSGFFASNNKIVAQGPHADPRVTLRLADVYLQKLNHGSGSIERESIIISNESTYNQIDPDMIYAFGIIATLDNHSMVYEPQTMSIDNGYYATHPVQFNSLLGEKAQVKNYASKTSMGQEINYAHAINMDLVASVEDDYYDTGVAKSLTKSLMNLNGDVTSGTAHLEMLQGGSRKSKSAWINPDIDVDQVYTGTFNFATKMNLTVPVYKSVSEDYWLPCCSGGWEDMSYSDKKGFGTDAKGIFDCTCPKEPAKA
jgi:hypothetical protein